MYPPSNQMGITPAVINLCGVSQLAIGENKVDHGTRTECDEIDEVKKIKRHSDS